MFVIIMITFTDVTLLLYFLTFHWGQWICMLLIHVHNTETLRIILKYLSESFRNYVVQASHFKTKKFLTLEFFNKTVYSYHVHVLHSKFRCSDILTVANRSVL